MISGSQAFFVVAVLLLLVLAAIRAAFRRRGSGRLAQLDFRRTHGATVGGLLDGEPDPNPASPWIHVTIDGRPARLVAAPVANRMQAGIELGAWRIPVDIWFTNGDHTELDIPEGITVEDVLDIVRRLAAADVDSVCSGEVALDRDVTAPHILRMQFDDVAELPDRIARVTPLLVELEQLTPADPHEA